MERSPAEWAVHYRRLAFVAGDIADRIDDNQKRGAANRELSELIAELSGDPYMVAGLTGEAGRWLQLQLSSLL